MIQRQLLVWLLRFIGTVEAIGFIAVVKRRPWMVSSDFLGMSPVSAGLLLDLIIRQASVYAVFLWVLSFDVIRFRPLITLLGVAYIVTAPFSFMTKFAAQMGLGWALIDPLSNVLLGALLLLLNRQQQRMTN